MNIRPSSRIVALIIAATGVVIGVVVWRSNGGMQNAPDDGAVAVVPRSVAVNETDTDGDGLKDWEEALWKTDPTNPDTDGDGIPDGEEIYSPDNFAVETSGAASADTSDTPPQNLSSTEKFSRSLLSRLLLFQGAGISVTDPSVLSSLVSSFSEMFGAEGGSQYGRPDISVVAATNEAVRTYGNGITRTITAISESSATTFPTSGTSNAAEVSALAETQEVALQQFLSIPVPESAVTVHLLLLNSFAAVVADIRDIATVNTDPIAAVAALRNYQTDLDALQAATQSFLAYLIANKQAFNESDYAYQFLK